MIEQKTYPSRTIDWILFIVSFLIATGGVYGLMNRTEEQSWSITVSHVIWIFSPLYFYAELLKYRQGYSKISFTTKKLFKCRISGADEVFYVQADTEAEVELFFEMGLDGKNVFIEEANIKLLGFDMEIPTKTNEA